jgi:hypothetical protein
VNESFGYSPDFFQQAAVAVPCPCFRLNDTIFCGVQMGYFINDLTDG